MKASMDERLDKLIESLSAQISFLRSVGLDNSARLLEMSLLEIRMHLHSITDHELRELCDAVVEPLQCAVTHKAADRTSPTREPVGGNNSIRGSAARSLVPIETSRHPLRTPRKHAH